jgi:hypothetical protein
VGRVPPEPIHPTMPSLPDVATLRLYRSLASSAFAAVFLALSAGRRDETHRPSGAAPHAVQGDGSRRGRRRIVMMHPALLPDPSASNSSASRRS